MYGTGSSRSSQWAVSHLRDQPCRRRSLGVVPLSYLGLFILLNVILDSVFYYLILQFKLRAYRSTVLDLKLLQAILKLQS